MLRGGAGRLGLEVLWVCHYAGCCLHLVVWALGGHLQCMGERQRANRDQGSPQPSAGAIRRAGPGRRQHQHIVRRARRRVRARRGQCALGRTFVRKEPRGTTPFIACSRSTRLSIVAPALSFMAGLALFSPSGLFFLLAWFLCKTASSFFKRVLRGCSLSEFDVSPWTSS